MSKIIFVLNDSLEYGRSPTLGGAGPVLKSRTVGIKIKYWLHWTPLTNTCYVGPMNEDGNTMSDQDQDRYGIDVRAPRLVWVVDLLAEEQAPPVKAFSGPDALANATREMTWLNSLADAGVNASAYLSKDATWKPLQAYKRPESLADTLHQAERAHTAALRSLAAEAEVLRRATERLLEVRGRIAGLPETAPRATQTVQDAVRAIQDGPGGASASAWLYGSPDFKAEIRMEDPAEMPAPQAVRCRCPGSCGHGSQS